MCARSSFAFACVEPVAVMSLDARQAFGGSPVRLHLGFWNDARGPRPALAQDSALCADVEDAIITKASACFQLHRSWGHKSAFVPGNANRCHTGTGREMEVDERCSGTGLFSGAGGAGLDAEGSALVQFERPEGRVQMVTGKVADSTGAKLPPGAPADRGVVGMIRTWRYGLEPALPIEAGRHGRGFFGSAGETGPAVSACAGPGVHIVDVTDRTIPYPFTGKADVLAGVSEVTELRSDAGLAGGFGDNVGLIDCAAKGLFTVEVFTLGDYGEVNYSMRMVWSSDEDGVDVFLIEHLIVVVVGRAGLAVLLSDQLDGGFQTRGTAVVEHAIVAELVDVT